MLACDTNILFPAMESSHTDHAKARLWLRSQVVNTQFVLCELTLLETYLLLRNPAVMRKTLEAPAAVALIGSLRSNPVWRIIDYPGGLMPAVWKEAAKAGTTFRRIVDTRMALTLRHHGVTQFATANLKHFGGFGFAKLWNPLTA